MPYKLRKVRGKSCYKVYNTTTKKVFSKCTDEESAKRQMRLLRALQNSKTFVPNARSRSNKTRKKNRYSSKKKVG